MRKLVLSLTILAATQASFAQQPVRLSMKDCMDYALKNNFAVKNAHIDVHIQEELAKQTTAAAMPHVNAKGDLVHFYSQQFSFFDASAFNASIPKGTIAPLPFTIPYTSSASITASQVLFDGSVLVALQAKNTVVELAKLSANATEENVRYNVFKSYNSLVIAYKQFDIIKNSLVLARSMQGDLEKMRNAGFVEKIDVDRSDVQINNLASDSLKVSNMLTVAEQALKYSLGMNLNTPIVLTDTAINKWQDEVARLVAEKENYERVPEYVVLATSLKLNEFNLKRYKYAALPTLAAFWSGGYNYGSATFEKIWTLKDYKPYSSAGLSLTMPIFNGFARVHQVREAKLNIEKTQNNIDNLKLTIDFQAATAKTNLKNSMLQVQSQRRNLDLSRNVMDLAQKKYKAGVGSNLEVTTAQTELLRSQNNYFTALLDVANAEADLKKALGMMK